MEAHLQKRVDSHMSELESLLAQDAQADLLLLFYPIVCASQSCSQYDLRSWQRSSRHGPWEAPPNIGLGNRHALAL